MKKIFSNKYVLNSLLVIGGLFLGWLIFHSTPKTGDEHGLTTQKNDAVIWTCSMHPQIRMNEPGKCPICGMDLIPLTQSAETVDPEAIHFTKEALALANVLTSVVTKQKPIKEVRLYGKIQADERLQQSQVAHISGRIEKLMVNFTGESVYKGQTLATLYSPELITAQQELLEASTTKQSQPEIYEAAKEKLRQWKLTETQISTIETSNHVQNNFEIVSNTAGIVTQLRVNKGDYVTQGTTLFDIADLSTLWVMFDAYETDLPFLNEGDQLNFTVQSFPGKPFVGNIIFIDPVIDPITRVSKVRLELKNQAGKLKPEMFVTGIVNANLTEYSNKLVIPRTAVLWTGKRSIVYVKQAATNDDIFKIREIELGPMLGSSYVVLNGLEESEEIAVNGTFSIDAAAQLEGKPSMMNPEDGKKLEGKNMPRMDMEKEVKINPSKIPAKFKQQLGEVVNNYLSLKDKLTLDNTTIKTEVKATQKSLKNVDMSLVMGDAHNIWMKSLTKLNKDFMQLEKATSIVEQRTIFSTISDELMNVVKKLGLEMTNKKAIYVDFCPMANNNKGGYWLSADKEIKNPYFGAKMIKCGEIKDTLTKK